MIRDQLSLLGLNGELIIDNFAGGGGASSGIELALGRCVDVAVNHDPEAVSLHAMNHPQTAHYCESVWDIDPAAVCDGRPVGLAWFSPDCKHFSKAKGGKPRDKKIRGLAWVVLRWAALVAPRVIILENVEEFQTWGPLQADGQPCQKRRGATFRSFVHQLRGHGYQVEWRELRACDYGAPTIRKRLFLIARRDGQPVAWPDPTHGAPGSAAVKARKLKPWLTAADCIDWSQPCPSIFERKKPLAEATHRRIARGIKRYVIETAEPFIVKYYGEKAAGEFRGSGLHEPLHTQSTENRFALVAPILTEHANGSHQRNFAADQPLRTQCAEVKGGHFALVSAFLAKHYGGNYDGAGVSLAEPTSTVTTVDHHALVAAHLVRQFGGSDAADVAAPVGTICAGGGGKTSLVASHMVKLRGTSSAAPATEPLHTVSSQGLHHAEVRAFLVKYYSEGGQWQGCSEPMHTIPTHDRIGLVTVAGQQYAIADIGMRMLEPRELYRAQGFPEHYIIDRSADGRALSKAAQVRMCGNSVCPPLAAALVRANCSDMAAWSTLDRQQKRGAA